MPLSTDYELALRLHAEGRLDEAEALCRGVLATEAGGADIWLLLGVINHAKGEHNTAIEAIRKALELEPHHPHALHNLGIAVYNEEDPIEAIRYFKQALECKPDFAEVCYNLGFAFDRLANWDEAIRYYRRAVALNPDYAEAHWNLSRLLLLFGDFENGWREHEWRWETGQGRLSLGDRPKWKGQPIEGKTILFYTEQGFGDAFHFVRYAELIKGRGARVLVQCEAPIRNLLARCPYIDSVVVPGDVMPPHDYHVLSISVPGILKTDLASIPAKVPYLFADPTLIEFWRQRLEAMEGFKIGVNWHGRPGQGDYRKRDIPFEQVASLANVPGVQLISLQKGEGQSALAKLGRSSRFVDLGPDIDQEHGAFMDTAAIMKNLDLVITSDTAVPHLAGALGVPVWLALPSVPDWRWLLDRSDSPWYPTMRLFRQSSPGDWEGVMTDVEAELRFKLGSLNLSAQ